MDSNIWIDEFIVAEYMGGVEYTVGAEETR